MKLVNVLVCFMQFGGTVMFLINANDMFLFISERFSYCGQVLEERENEFW